MHCIRHPLQTPQESSSDKRRFPSDHLNYRQDAARDATWGELPMTWVATMLDSSIIDSFTLLESIIAIRYSFIHISNIEPGEATKRKSRFAIAKSGALSEVLGLCLPLCTSKNLQQQKKIKGARKLNWARSKPNRNIPAKLKPRIMMKKTTKKVTKWLLLGPSFQLGEKLEFKD